MNHDLKEFFLQLDPTLLLGTVKYFLVLQIFMSQVNYDIKIIFPTRTYLKSVSYNHSNQGDG